MGKTWGGQSEAPGGLEIRTAFWGSQLCVPGALLWLLAVCWGSCLGHRAARSCSACCATACQPCPCRGAQAPGSRFPFILYSSKWSLKMNRVGPDWNSQQVAQVNWSHGSPRWNKVTPLSAAGKENFLLLRVVRIQSQHLLVSLEKDLSAISKRGLCVYVLYLFIE